MEFYSTIKGSRPIRLSEATRKFAYDSLQGVYGRQTSATPALEADAIDGFAAMTPYQQYDAMIRLIAEKAPLRLCEGELLCGSATLGMALAHVIPVTYQGRTVMGSVSHLTCGFDRVVREGLDSYRDRIIARLAQDCTPEENEFLHSLLHTYEAIQIWHTRYMTLLLQKIDAAQTDSERRYYQELYDASAPVPFQPAQTYRQALQSIWFSFAFTRLCGNWSGIGRLDFITGEFLEKELAEGSITEEEARELTAHFFIKGCEWIRLDPNARGSGDAQHYQNIVLAGCDSAGNNVVNTATRLILDVVEEFPISDFPIAVRMNQDSPPWLFQKIAAVMRHGSGVAAIYNNQLIIDSLIEFGYSPEEARLFANDGCWEVQVPGKTCFSYSPMDMLSLFEKETRNADYHTFEDMYAAFQNVLRKTMESWHNGADGFAKIASPMTVVALFVDDCIEKARDYHNGGARYTVFSPHFGGVPDTANAMYAIQKLVFEEKKTTFAELMQILRDNWEGHEELRRYVRNAYAYYGNDNDEADALAVRLMNDFITETRRVKSRNDVLRPPGISTFGRQIDWKDIRSASAQGSRTGDILSSNLSPAPGTDKAGATAVIRSHCKIDYSRLTCGTALDLKLDPTAVKGDDGLQAIEGLMRGFLALGGFFLQIDVLDNAILLEAQKHPEQYQNLAVRISGWSARFVTLCDTWQQMIIERSTLQ